jgi:hypothetical protein
MLTSSPLGYELTPTNHGDAVALTLLAALSLVPSSCTSALLQHTLSDF